MSSNEIYDFLIDIIPREDQPANFPRNTEEKMPFDQVMYVYVSVVCVFERRTTRRSWISR